MHGWRRGTSGWAAPAWEFVTRQLNFHSKRTWKKGLPIPPEHHSSTGIQQSTARSSPHPTRAQVQQPPAIVLQQQYFAPCRREQCCQHLLSTSASPSGLQLTSPSLFTRTAVISKLRNILGENVFSCLDRSWSVKYCKKSCHSYLPLSVEQLLQSLRENNIFFCLSVTLLATKSNTILSWLYYVSFKKGCLFSALY